MDLLSLVEQDVTLRGRGKELFGPCPRCGGTDRFRVWPQSNRYWCRQCGIRGDTIQFLRDVRGLSFQAAAVQVGKVLPERNEGQTRRHAARDALLVRFFRWQHEKLRSLNDLHDQIFIAEHAWRSICRAPELWTNAEQTEWAHRIGQLYTALDNTLQEYEQLCDEETAWNTWKESRGA